MTDAYRKGLERATERELDEAQAKTILTALEIK